jgi:uncharacterized phage-associated protein
MTTTIFNIDKSLNAVLYITGKLQRKDFHKIFKILYFADRKHLLMYGRTITGDTYIKMNYGPVPSKIYDILKAVRGDGFFTEDVKNYRNLFTVNDYFVKPLKEADLDFLSKTDIELLDASIAEYGSLSFEKTTKISHGTAWEAAKYDCPIDIENILKEVTDDECYIKYIKDFYNIQNFLQ